MLNINDYTYTLPPEKIALYPLEQRDASKLLVFQEGKVGHRHFTDLPDVLPGNTFLFFNDTRVIPARLIFRKETGAAIEVFLLHPVRPSPLLSETLQATTTCAWKCTIGNLKRWPAGKALHMKLGSITLEALLENRDEGLVQFRWLGQKPFAWLVEQAGKTPLPPYLHREAEDLDKVRYQTVYSNAEGAVAAPTAGLHFTERVFKRLQAKNIGFDFLTLHVGAGTFQPVKTENADEHKMHEEQLVVSRGNIENLLAANRFVIPVGTTAMRTLESLYWFGVKLLEDPSTPFVIGQDDPYLKETRVPREQALAAVKRKMDESGLDKIVGETSIFIKPGYTFRVCQGLITNFHQPSSTLLLLIAAFVGASWKTIYQEALQSHYRFLSYGDSSLLIPKK